MAQCAKTLKIKILTIFKDIKHVIDIVFEGNLYEWEYARYLL